MKRITNIEIENFRAYFGPYDSIDFPAGQNVLIYGENGSGKSSFFKALSNFFSSSKDPAFQYVKHFRQHEDEGFIKITFHEFNPIALPRVSGIGQTITFGS